MVIPYCLSCPESKGLLSHRLLSKRTRSGDVQSKPSAAGLHGEDKHVHHPEIDGAHLYNEFEDERCKLF